MFSSILQISVSACSMITLRHSLLMQPHHFAIAYLWRSSLWGNHSYFSYPVLCLSSFCGTRKEVHMEIREAVSFYHSRVKYVTLQELLANNTWSLIGDSNKISKHSRVFRNKCQVWVDPYIPEIVISLSALWYSSWATLRILEAFSHATSMPTICTCCLPCRGLKFGGKNYSTLKGAVYLFTQATFKAIDMAITFLSRTNMIYIHSNHCFFL